MSDPQVENMTVVNIYGEEYPITGASDAAYITKVAEYVDARMREVASSGRTTSRDRIAILAAMSIASELLEKQDEVESLETSVETRAENICSMIDIAVRD